MSARKLGARQVAISMSPGETDGERGAATLIDGLTQAAASAAMLQDNCVGGIEVCGDALRRLAQARADALGRGDMASGLSALSAQATTLDLLFHNLLRRGLVNMGEYMGAAELYIKLALRAQAQCRATVEAINEVTHPHHVFVGQNNIAQNQQVNNGTATPAREQNSESAKGTIEHEQSERLDARAPETASRADSELEAVGLQYGAPDN